jgi:hypothetical protein
MYSKDIEIYKAMLRLVLALKAEELGVETFLSNTDDLLCRLRDLDDAFNVSLRHAWADIEIPVQTALNRGQANFEPAQIQCMQMGLANLESLLSRKMAGVQ